MSTDTDMTIPPIPFLSSLRGAVLERSTARMPKWRFRFASDLVVRIQPKPIPKKPPNVLSFICHWTIRFECRAVLCETATAAMLEHTPDVEHPWWFRNFIIQDRPDGLWEIRRRGGMCKRGSDHNGFAILDTRFREALAGGVFDGYLSELMLSPQCLVCGKGLTDPASMARFIGPECSGTSSLLVPGLFAMKGGGA